MMTAVFVIMCHLGDNPTEIINRPESWQQCEPVPYRFAFGHSPNILPNLRIVHQLEEVLFKTRFERFISLLGVECDVLFQPEGLMKRRSSMNGLQWHS